MAKKNERNQYVEPTEQHDRPLTAEFETGEMFEPRRDESGRIRVDRRFTPAEAAAQDARHRERAEAERLAKFSPTSERRSS